MCVVPATINTAPLLFGKPLVLTKPAPHPSYPLLWSLRIPQPSNPSPNVVCVCGSSSPNVVCVCGSSDNQHCSAAFLASLWCWQSRLHIHLTPYCGICASHSHLTHHPMLCVCVVPATINTALLLFGKPLGLTKPAPHPSLRTCALLSIFVHSFSSLSPSFSLTFSFLNLSFLLSPFSIFLSYFLLSQSFSLTFSFFYLSLFICPRLFHSQFNI